MDNLLRKLFASMLGMWIVKYLWTRFIPIPYEAVEQCKPLPEFIQDPIQIMNLHKQLEASGMTRAAYVHPESFALMIVLALDMGIFTLYIYPLLNKIIGDMPWRWRIFFSLICAGMLHLVFTTVAAAIKILIAIQYGPLYEIMSITNHIAP